MRGFLWDPPRVPTYYNFAWVPHTFGGSDPSWPPLISHTGAIVLKHDNIFSRFDRVPACNGQTDGRTDVKPIAITCFSIADARKNVYWSDVSQN